MKAQQVPGHDGNENVHSEHQMEPHSDHFDHHDDPHLKQLSSSELKYIHIQGYLSILGGICLHLVLGTFYLWGGISPYAAAYLRQFDSNVNLTTMSLIFPIMGLATNSVLSFGVKLAEKIGFKTVIGICGTTISLAFLILSFVESFIAFASIYCIMIGISSGLVYMLPIICGWKFFPAYKGRVSGPIIAGYGFGAFIFNFVCQAYVNPNNKHPTILDSTGHKYFDKEVYDKVPNMFRILSGSYFALTIIATILVKYPKDLHLEYQMVDTAKNKQQQIVVPVVEQQCESLYLLFYIIHLTRKQGMKSKPFVFLIIMVLFSTMLGMLMANCYKIYGLYQELDDKMLTIVGAIASVSNGCSRAAWAFLMDKFGFKCVFLIISVINLITSGLLGYTNGNAAAYLILLAVTMGCEGGLFATFPAVSGKIFGHKVGPIIYGVFFFAIGLSNLTAYLLFKFTLDTIHYTGLFWIMFGLNVVSLCLGICFTEVHSWAN